ncbi:Cullin-domain-containing protein [Filobasidium floriforme]|uniref:Cullin-domain-containing protein n=1 Tax=Filobasidium floriforme TaxID=5210 RepID=UPI001E8EA151|nr:Cullin-domain-containing protein [Filobasidium floriforme]KAH8081415.1 Cullin-domain-containing protein [Filobasidium floriforme]
MADLQEPTKGPPTNASLETSWNFLKTGVDRIMVKLEHGMSYSYYMLLYTACYNYCISSNKQHEISGYGSVPVGSSGTVKAGAHLMGSDLYNKLSDYLKTHLARLRTESENLSDLALLQFYTKEWKRYTTGANYVNRLFAYLNRHWVKREKDEGRKGIYTVYTLSLVQWKEHFFLGMVKDNNNRLITALLKQIESHRNGEQVDGGMIKSIVDSMVSLGLEDEQHHGGKDNKTHIEVYREHFQKPFLTATENYYKAESEGFLAENNISDYLRLAEKRLDEEENRVNLYMHSQTKQPLLQRAENALVTSHLARMQEEFGPLLDADRQEDLARMWKLLNRVDGLGPLRETFQEHVTKNGLDAVSRASQGTVGADGKQENMDPKTYVTALLEVYKKNLAVVEKPFEGDTGFQAALDKACRTFINKNPAAAEANKAPELIALYVDQQLKKSNKETADESMEEALNDSMTLFKYLDHRDIFMRFYSRRLADRLLRGTSMSEEAEGSMISKLKDQCGYDYVTKLQKMLTDVSLSKELTESFNEKMANNGHDDKVDFSVIVGGSVNWPLASKAVDFQVPRELQPMLDRFKGYYNNSHSGRALTWMWLYSKNEVQLSYLKPKITLMCSTYQLAVLMLFNEEESLHFADIEARTKLSPEILKPVMTILVKSKVLLVDGDTYDINYNMKSKKVRLNINVPMKAEQKKESDEVTKAAEEDRKYIYQATIVRIMKSRKTMKHQHLINEVSQHVSKNFPPVVSMIKKTIEHLVDQDYLERADGQNDTYNYLA